MKQIRTLIGFGLALILAAPAAAAKTHRRLHEAKYRVSAKDSQMKKIIAQGQAALDEHRYPQAVRLFETATKIDPSSAEAFNQLGRAYYQWAFRRGPTRDADEAEAQQATMAYRTAIDLDPKLKSISNPYILYDELAKCYQAMRQYDNAISALKTASHLSPNDPMPALYAALVRYRMHDLLDSSANLDLSVRLARRTHIYPTLAKLIRANPAFSDLLKVPQNRAILEVYDQVDQGRLTAADARSLVPSVQPPARPKAVLVAKRPVPEATDYRDALRNDPSLVARKKMAEIPRTKNVEIDKLIRRGDQDFKFRHFREAIADYATALNENKNAGTLTMAQKSVIYEHIGASYRLLGLARQAISALRASVTELPSNASAYYQMALTYSTSGQFPQALGALDLALKNAHTPQDLRRIFLMAKTDSELDPVRDMAAFQKILKPHTAPGTTRPSQRQQGKLSRMALLGRRHPHPRKVVL